MTFLHRIAALAAVVLIPVGIAVTSYLLSDDPQEPPVPAEVELDERDGEGTSSPSPTTDEPRQPDTPTDDRQPDAPNDEVVPPPSATEGPIDDEAGEDRDDAETDDADTDDAETDDQDEDGDDNRAGNQ